MKKLFKDGIKIQVLNAIVIILGIVFSFLLLQAANSTIKVYEQETAVTEKYYACERAANDLMDASNNLTTQVRMFAITLEPEYVEGFFEEKAVTMRREKAIATLRENLPEDSEAIAALEEALYYSNQLVDIEYYALKLGVVAEDIEITDKMFALNDIELLPEDMGLSREEKIAKGRDLVVNEYFKEQKAKVTGAVQRCKDILASATEAQAERTGEILSDLFVRQRVLTILLLAVVVFTIFLVIYLILMPLTGYISKIQNSEPLPERGASELRYLSRAYNEMYEETKRATESLRHAAEHDALTRLYNRRAFDSLREQFRDNVALLLVDVDHFKGFNDSYGHDMGDKVLQKVAKLLRNSFRFSDYPCRQGGDEFAVIMTQMTPELRDVVLSKVKLVRQGLLDTSDGLPEITLSIGVSFGHGEAADDIFKAADNALYDVKERGRNGMSFNIDGEIIVGI